VVWLEGVAVGIAEGVGEFLVGVGDVVAESLGGEVETTWYVLVVYIMCDGKGMYRVSHRRPSVAVCFFSLSSLRQSSWRVSESAGAASCRSRIFCILLAMSCRIRSSRVGMYLDVANHVVLDRLEGC
jgi:hypothetical protein